jgi:hypothetical protein
MEDKYPIFMDLLAARQLSRVSSWAKTNVKYSTKQHLPVFSRTLLPSFWKLPSNCQHNEHLGLTKIQNTLSHTLTHSCETVAYRKLLSMHSEKISNVVVRSGDRNLLVKKAVRHVSV